MYTSFARLWVARVAYNRVGTKRAGGGSWGGFTVVHSSLPLTLLEVASLNKYVMRSWSAYLEKAFKWQQTVGGYSVGSIY